MAAIPTKRASVHLSLTITAPADSSRMRLASSTPPTSTKSKAATTIPPHRAVGVWSSEEHDRFLEALKKYPQGPWKAITNFVRTRSVRQVQTHAQKYQEKVSRRLHGMQTGKAVRQRREHRIDHEVLAHHTLITFPPELRHKSARPNHQHHHEVQVVGVSMPPRAPARTLSLEYPPIGSGGKGFCPIMDNNGASPSSVTSSFLFDEAVFTLTDTDNLPTLSESLDFFIENFS